MRIIGVHNYNKRKKHLIIPMALSTLTLAVSGIVGLGGRIWASGTDMTTLTFTSAVFCTQVSLAIDDSLGSGTADGRDCSYRKLYVSSAEINNIQTLNIMPRGLGLPDNVNWEVQPMEIGGQWLRQLPNLTSLSITDMYVQDIAPLQNMSGALTYLNLSNNSIYDVTPLQTLKSSLVELNLSNNPASSGIRELSRFTALTKLNMSNTGIGGFDELFSPSLLEAETDDEGGLIRVYDTETGETVHGAQFDDDGNLIQPTNSKLAEVLREFNISNNESMSNEKEENSNACEGSLSAFETYKRYLVINKLYANGNNLNSDDLQCISKLNDLETLDVSNNHIDDFSSIRTKRYTSLKADSQTFTRYVEGLDYSPLPAIFSQAATSNYFTGMTNSNTAVAQDNLELDNAQFRNNGSTLRFINAAIALESSVDPHPATMTIPAGTGVFENSKLQVYFAGQVVTFRDKNLCDRIYAQGMSLSAFYDIDLVLQSSESPILTYACDQPKIQIAMISGGSDKFLRLDLDRINAGSRVDLTGLDKFSNLQLLELRDNSLINIDKLAGMYQLQQLYLDDNNLDSDAWSVITDNLLSLKILSLNNNYLEEISPSLSNLSSLGDLYLANNGISDVSPLAQASTLTNLDLSENNISDFSGMVQEDSACNPILLKMENSGVTRLPDASIMSRFTSLTNLNLNNNQITDNTIANLAAAPRLGELHLDNNRITSTAGFSGVTTLMKLFLDNNQITDVSGLPSLTRLTELHLKNNKISNITGLNNLPVLATLDLKDQTLTGTISEADEAYVLPAIFSQAKTMEFANVNGFQSTAEYAVVNGELNSSEMSATMVDTSEAMTVTIPDGGLAGAKVTVTYTGTGGNGGNEDLASTLTNNTNSDVTITITSANSFTVTSDNACMALYTQDGGATWARLNSSTVANSIRSFNLDQTNGVEVKVAYAGDVDGKAGVDIRDARKIVNAITGKATLSSAEMLLANVDGKAGVDIRDARAVINNITGKAKINW